MPLVVARGDRSVENLGRVAELVETGAALQVGTVGRADGGSSDSPAGRNSATRPVGSGTRWYAAFADGRWGWLAEAQGQYHLLFELPGAATACPSTPPSTPAGR